MPKLEHLTQYILEKYKPISIILHGSRASGKNRPHSDWDFILLLSLPKKVVIREIREGENIEVVAKVLPIKDTEILDVFGVKLRNAQVLFDTDGVGAHIVSVGQEKLKEPMGLSGDEKTSRVLHLYGRLMGMEEIIDTPELFFDYASDFYERAIMYWFHVFHDSWSLPPYESMPYIKEKEPEFYSQLLIIATGNNQEKLKAAKEIYKKFEKFL